MTDEKVSREIDLGAFWIDGFEPVNREHPSPLKTDDDYRAQLRAKRRRVKTPPVGLRKTKRRQAHD